MLPPDHFWDFMEDGNFSKFAEKEKQMTHDNAFKTGGQTFQPKNRERNDQDDEMFARLMTACRGVPHLATCMYETLKSAGLRVVPSDPQ